MAGITYAYDAAGRHEVAAGGLKAYDAPTGRHDVDVVYAYTADGRRKITYVKSPPNLTVISPYWDQANLSWTAAPYPVTKYVARLGSTVLYTGTATAVNVTYPQVVLAPSSSYTFSLDTYYHDGVSEILESTDSYGLVTQAFNWSSFTATSPQYNLIQLRWAAQFQRSVNQFIVYKEQTGWGQVYNGAGLGHDDWAVSASTFYRYHLYAYRAGVQIGAGIEATRTTPARPTSTGSTTVNSPQYAVYNGASNPTVYNTWNPGGTTRYGYQMWLQAAGYNGSSQIWPKMGTEGGAITLPNAAYAIPTSYWSAVLINVGIGDTRFPLHANTANQIGMRRNTANWTQWRCPTSADRQKVHFKINYWWYAATVADVVHEEILIDPDGTELAKWVYNQETGEVISSMGPDPQTWYDGLPDTGSDSEGAEVELSRRELEDLKVTISKTKRKSK